MTDQPANPAKIPLSQRSPVLRFARWLFSWRTIRRGLVSVAVLFTVVALFYAEENWRGKHAWNKFKREWAAKAEKLDYESFVPPPVPDDQNFAMAPFWEDARHEWQVRKEGLPNATDTNLMNRLAHLQPNIYRTRNGHPTTDPRLGSWWDGTNTILKAWQEYYRIPDKTNRDAQLNSTINEFPIPPQPAAPAGDVLMALGKYDDTLQLLRSAGQRPSSRFPINYDDVGGVYLFHLAKLKGTANFLDLLVVAELDSGRISQAAEDLKLLFYLGDSVKTEPFIVSHLVRVAVQDRGISALWEGLSIRKWTPEQLLAFQNQLESEHMLADVKPLMAAQSATDASTLDDLAATRVRGIAALFEGRELYPALIQYVRFAPRGWFEQEKVLNARPYLEEGTVIDPENQRVDFQRLDSIEASFKQSGTRPYVLSHFWFGDDDLVGPYKVIQKAARTQTSVNLAAVACALERYWFVKDAYPEKLEELSPQFIAKLPHELASGEPFKYRRSDDGRFVLYSTGIEGKDTGGFYRGPDGKLTGNWVWRYPTK